MQMWNLEEFKWPCCIQGQHIIYQKVWVAAVGQNKSLVREYKETRETWDQEGHSLVEMTQEHHCFLVHLLAPSWLCTCTYKIRVLFSSDHKFSYCRKYFRCLIFSYTPAHTKIFQHRKFPELWTHNILLSNTVVCSTSQSMAYKCQP